MFSRKPDPQPTALKPRLPVEEAVIMPSRPPQQGDRTVALLREDRQPAYGLATSGETIISNDLMIVGNVISKGRVKLEGTVEGDMSCASLEVSESGAVSGTIVAEQVSVYGRVSGTIRGKHVQLYATAHVEGDIFHQGIGIELGTHYDGRLKWGDGAGEAPGTTSREPAAPLPLGQSGG